MGADDDLDLGQTIRGFVGGQKVFGRYELERVLGRGGMGVVWLARDAELERRVALKFMPELIRLDSVAIDELKRETRRSLELTHPNIVRIYDFVQDAQTAAISMEYVEGRTLAGMRVEKESRVFEAWELEGWLRELMEALDYAHNRARVVHRDLKPANLMVGREGELKVADFGIARSISDSASRMSAGAGGSGGTLSYMSPQQALGEAAVPADDIYAVGATIYDLLTGKPPFHTGNIYAQVKEKKAPRMGERRRELGFEGGEIPEEWEEMVGRCLAKEAGERPGSIVEALEPLVGGGGRRRAAGGAGAEREKEVAERREIAAEPGRKAAEAHGERRSGRGMVYALLGVLMLAGVAAGGWYWGYHLPAERERIALEAAEAATTKAREEAAAQTERARLAADAKAREEEAAERARLAEEERKKKEEEEKAKTALAGATKERPYENSLGMKFVPVPGTGVLFSVWNTRVADFRAYAQDTGFRQTGGAWTWNGKEWKQDEDASWENPGFEQGEDHPVVGVSWEEAQAFCRWLTEKERGEGKIGQDQEYRLPTDAEWSVAVGGGKYPWGERWPPPKGAGNYDPSLAVDSYRYTSPCGALGANELGLCDMGGNVSQWCEDWYRAEMNEADMLEKYPILKHDGGGGKWRVLRGGSWFDDVRGSLLSSYRNICVPGRRNVINGFRVVCEAGAGG